MLFFERLPAGLRITTAGNAVLAQAQDMEPGLDRLERMLLSRETGLSGPLRITLPPLLMIGDIAKDIAQFARAHPEIELQFVGDNQLLNLHQREADVAIRVTHQPPETLWGRKVTDQHAGFFANTEWLDQSGLADDDLSCAIPIISFTSWPSPIPKVIDRFCPNAHVVAQCEDMVTAIQLVKSGLGITRMPRFLGEMVNGITRLDFLPWERYSPIWILTHPELKDAPRVRVFMRFMAMRFAERRNKYCVG